MGAIYTNTDNAIRCTGNIAGKIGKKGYSGKLGPTGNPTAWMAGDISNDTPTVTSITNQLINGILSPVDKDGNTLPLASTVPGLIPVGVWPVLGDYYVDSDNGNLYKKTSGTDGVVNANDWTYQENVNGQKGPDNFLKTEVSFNGEESLLGYSVNKYDKKTLCGHLIWPGKDLSGDINSVKVLINCNTEGINIRATVYLVNLGVIVSGSDDILIASSAGNLVSGRGDDASWRILDLNVNNSVVPNSQALFGVFVLLRPSRQGEIDHMKEIQESYNDEIAAMYAERLKDTEKTDINAFYEVVEEEGIKIDSESPVKRTRRIAEREAYLEKRKKAELDAAIRFEEGEIQSKKFPGNIKNEGDTGFVWESTPVLFKGDIKLSHITIS